MPGAVQGLHHVAELIHRAERIAPGAVLRVRGEVGDGLIPPVVDQPRAGRRGRRRREPAASSTAVMPRSFR